MNELVVISGKGGTGKTSVVASLAALAAPVVLADCDVDAPDLHLVLEPQVANREPFIGGYRAAVRADVCRGCGCCVELCRFGAATLHDLGHRRLCRIDALACEGCGVCERFCPHGAIVLNPTVSGECFLSHTRHGPMSHAQLGICQENSGKLVTGVRRNAREMAKRDSLDLVLSDGPPGIGCPVIASLTGADLALIVIEPTVSGVHDFERVGRLVRRLRVAALVCVNKYDLNPDAAEVIEVRARAIGIEPVGRIPYDGAVTRAQVLRKSVVEASDGPAAQAIRELWPRVAHHWRQGPAGTAGNAEPAESAAGGGNS